MRTIKFRGRDPYNNQWVYGDLVHGSNDGRVAIVNDDAITDVDPETIGQYTGFTDRKGVPIYEGDLLYHPILKRYHKVKVINGGFMVQSQKDKTDIINIAVAAKSNLLEVKGNIHDNRNLCKVERSNDASPQS